MRPYRKAAVETVWIVFIWIWDAPLNHCNQDHYTHDLLIAPHSEFLWFYIKLNGAMKFTGFINNYNFDGQFLDQLFKFKSTSFNSYCSRVSQPLSPECRLEGGHLLRGCQLWAHSLWPCGTEPSPFSLPVINTHSPHPVKELQILSFVLHPRTSNLAPPAPNCRGPEIFQLVRFGHGSDSILLRVSVRAVRDKMDKLTEPF